MREGATLARWRPAVAVALVVAGAWVAVGFVPHAVGGFGDDPVVTDPGPPPSVDAFRDDPRKRYRNRVADRVVAFAPVAVPVVGAFAGAVAVRRRRGDGAARTTLAAACRVGAGAFLGGVVGYLMFLAVVTQAYAAVPGGYLVASYPPTVSAAAVAANALGTSVPTAVGAFLGSFVATYRRG
ncbi:hypothetical protein [Halorubellus sp. PRR65]|uniref:hypothetical protein n=1 Tax=Halorubellus sp. PRR65 TaxID=3098148 RepID=UPI002B260AD7|nr:hypothetical protein [Halorubellus sp. PRR65]